MRGLFIAPAVICEHMYQFDVCDFWVSGRTVDGIHPG